MAFPLNPFHTTGLFLHLLKTSEIQRFSDIFKEYRKRPVACNGLKSNKDPLNNTAKNTVISPNFLVWKFSGKVWKF